MSMLPKNLNLSPIRHSDEVKQNLKDESKMKDFPEIKFNFDKKASKKAKGEKTNPKPKLPGPKANLSVHGKKEDPKLKYPKNINEYRHIMANFQIVHADLNWILDLRTNKELSKYKKNNSPHMWPPSFYEDDLNKYRTRMKSMSKDSSNLSLTGNINPIEHLAKDRLGATGNWSQFAFETTLRNFRPYETVYGPKAKWMSLPYKQKNREMTPFLPPTLGYNKKAFKDIEKFISHPVAPVYDEAVLSNNTMIKRRRYEPNKTETLNFLGEHRSQDKYKDVHKGRNINEARHIMSHHSNTLSRFELGLREYASRKENKMTDNTLETKSQEKKTTMT